MNDADHLAHPLHALSHELLAACANLARTRDATDALWQRKARLALRLVLTLTELAEEDAGRFRGKPRAPAGVGGPVVQARHGLRGATPAVHAPQC